ncbi:MAG: 2-hydroxyacid dehydrogenase, partial [Tannerellaceae bacterium]
MNTDDKNIKVVLFSAKSYDKTSFDLVNEKYGFDIEYHEDTLSEQNLILTKGADVVCVFVNDVVTDELIEGMLRNDVKLLALRCAGFNNVDLKAAQNRLPVVRVPA